MNIGMMWAMVDKRMTLEMEIKTAMQYYKSKYGKSPDRCHVSPKYMDKLPEIKGITIEPDSNIMPNHLWVGKSDAAS